MRNKSLPKTQQGVALAVALVVLVGVTVVSLSSLTVSLLEVRMAENEEARMIAFQKAQAGVDAVGAALGNIVVTGAPGQTNCTGNTTTSALPDPLPPQGCNTTTLTLPTGFDGRHAALTERLEPELQCPPAAMETSCAGFSVANFAIESRYDNTQRRGGRSTIFQGLLVLVPDPKP